MRVGDRLGRLERAILRPRRIDLQQVEDTRRSLLAEVAQLKQAHGIVPTADQETVLRELDRALRELCDHRMAGAIGKRLAELERRVARRPRAPDARHPGSAGSPVKTSSGWKHALSGEEMIEPDQLRLIEIEAAAGDLGSNVILTLGKPQHLLGNGTPRIWLAAVDMEDGEPPEHRKELLRLTESVAEFARPGVSFAGFGSPSWSRG